MTDDRLTPHQWRALGASIYLPTGLSMVGFGAVAPLVALAARAVGASVAEAALVVALNGVGSLVGALPAGVLADRLGEKRALIGALVVDAAALVVAGFAPNVWGLAAAVFVVGLSSAVLMLARQSYLTEAVPYRFRARALSTLGGVFRIGSFIGPLAGAATVHAWGLPAAFVMASLICLVAAAITLALPDLPGEGASIADAVPEPVRLAPVLRAHAHTYLTVGLGASALMLVRAARDALLPLWGDLHHFDAATISLIYALSSGVDMLLFYVGGLLMDRFGRAAVAVPSMVIMGTCFALLTLTSTELGLALVGVGLGLGNGISSGVVMTLGSDASPDLGRSQFLGGWRLVTGIGQALGPVLITAVAAVAPLSYAALGVALAGYLGAAWLWRWRPVPPPHAA